MESEVIQTFNKALVSMQDNKSGVVSKQKVFEITKAAMSAVRYFKHVVFIIERYLVKCRPEYKVPALYVMDSILRQAKKQYKHKDVFAPRFALNLTNTISNVLTCVSENRPKVVRVVNLWLAHQVFSEEAIEPVLQHCRASGLEVEPARVEALVKGEKADMHLYNQSAGSADHSFASSGGSIKKETVSKTPVEKRSPGIPPPPAPQQPAGHATSRAEPPSAHHPQSLEERLSQFSRQKLGGAPPPPLQRTNSQQHTGTSTPRTVESGPKTPPLEDQDHRVSTGQFSTGRKESHQNGAGLSAVDVNALLGAGQMGAEALGRVQKFLNSRIQESLEIERRHQCNIKNLLAREFDYSDEEDEGGSASAQHGGPAQQLSTMGRDALVQAARQLLANATVQQEIQRLVMDQPPPPQQPRPAAFQMPDFSVPPPGAPPRFLPPQMTFASLPPPGVMPQMPIGFAPNIPPPGIFGAQQPQQQAAVRDDRDQQRRDRDRGEQRQGDRERSGSDGRRPPIRAPSRERERSHTSGSGRKRTREWSPSEEGRGRRERSRERSRERGESTRRGSSGRGERDERSDRVRRERDQSAEERERAKRQREEQREQVERERRRIGLPSKPKEDHVLIASRTLWFGRCPVNCTEADIVEAVKEVATPEKISIVGARGCAYVTMPDRKSAFKIIDRMAKQLQVAKKNVKLDWATISGLKDDVALREDYWDLERGLAQIPYGKLPGGSVDALLEGAWLDVDTLPAHLKDKYTNTGLKANLVQQQQLTAQQQLATALIPVPASAAAGPFQLISAQGQMMPAIMTAPIFSQAAAMNLAVAANLAAAANLQQQFSFPPPQLTQQPQQGGTGATKESGGFANAGFGSVTPTGGTGFGQQPQQQYGSGSGFGGRGGGGDWRGRGRGGGRGGTGYTPRFAGTPDAGRGRGGGPGGGYRGGAGRGRGWAGAEHSGGGAGEWGGGGAGGGYRGGTAGRGRGWSGGDGTGDFGGRSNSFSAAHQQQQSSDSEGNLAVATITATQQQNEIHKQEAPKNSGAPPTVAQTAVPSETETELPPGCD